METGISDNGPITQRTGDIRALAWGSYSGKIEETLGVKEPYDDPCDRHLEASREELAPSR